MEALIASVRSAAASGASLADQRALLDAGVAEIGSSGASAEALRASLLAALDAEPALPRSIFYLYLLDAAWPASTDADAPRLAELSSAFASSIDPELAREAAPKLAYILNKTSSFFSSQDAARCSLLPLTMALRKMQHSGGEITPLHPLLFESALKAQNPRAALPVLDDLLGGGGGGNSSSSATSSAAPPEISLAPEVTGVSARDVLLTFYFAGLLRAARREWDLASAAFALAIAVPAAAAPSSIASEAFKKWTLVHVAAGRGPPPSVNESPAARSASPAVLRAVKADAAAYRDLARAAGRGVSTYARTAAKEGGAPFVAPGGGGEGAGNAAASGDGQLGLLRAAVRGERDRALAALSRIYAALPLGDILAKAGDSTGRRLETAAAAAAAAVDEVEVEEEEEEEEGEEEGREDAVATALSFIPRAPGDVGGDEVGDGGGGGGGGEAGGGEAAEEAAVEQQQQQQEQQQQQQGGDGGGGDAAAAAAATRTAAFGLRPRGGAAPRDSAWLTSQLSQPPHPSAWRQQQRQSPAARRAAAEARAAATAAARAASASFEASLLPPKLAIGGSGSEGDREEEEAERALWSLADAVLASTSSSLASASSSVSSFELPPLAHSTLIRMDTVSRTVSFESEAEAAATRAASSSSSSVSALTLMKLRRALDAVNELTARVKTAAHVTRTDPEMVRRAAERQRGASAAAEESTRARIREAQRQELEQAVGGEGDDLAMMA